MNRLKAALLGTLALARPTAAEAMPSKSLSISQGQGASVVPSISLIPKRSNVNFLNELTSSLDDLGENKYTKIVKDIQYDKSLNKERTRFVENKILSLNEYDLYNAKEKQKQVEDSINKILSEHDVKITSKNEIKDSSGMGYRRSESEPWVREIRIAQAELKEKINDVENIKSEIKNLEEERDTIYNKLYDLEQQEEAAIANVKTTRDAQLQVNASKERMEATKTNEFVSNVLDRRTAKWGEDTSPNLELKSPYVEPKSKNAPLQLITSELPLAPGEQYAQYSSPNVEWNMPQVKSEYALSGVFGLSTLILALLNNRGRQKNKQLQKKIVEIQSVVQKHENELQVLKAGEIETERNIRNMKSQLENKNKKLELHRSQERDANKLKSGIKKLEQTLSDLNRQLVSEKTQSAYNKKTAKLSNERLNAETRKVTQLTSKSEQLTKENVRAQETITQKSDQKIKIEKEKKAVEFELNRLHASFLELDKQLNKSLKENNQLLVQTSSLEKTIDALLIKQTENQISIKEKNIEIGSLKLTSEKQQLEIIKLGLELKVSQSQNEKLKQELKSGTEKYDKLAYEFSTLEKEFQLHTRVIEFQEKALETLQQEKADLKQKLEDEKLRAKSEFSAEQLRAASELESVKAQAASELASLEMRAASELAAEKMLLATEKERSASEIAELKEQVPASILKTFQNDRGAIDLFISIQSKKSGYISEDIIPVIGSLSDENNAMLLEKVDSMKDRVAGFLEFVLATTIPNFTKFLNNESAPAKQAYNILDDAIKKFSEMDYFQLSEYSIEQSKALSEITDPYDLERAKADDDLQRNQEKLKARLAEIKQKLLKIDKTLFKNYDANYKALMLFKLPNGKYVLEMLRSKLKLSDETFGRIMYVCQTTHFELMNKRDQMQSGLPKFFTAIINITKLPKLTLNDIVRTVDALPYPVNDKIAFLTTICKEQIDISEGKHVEPTRNIKIDPSLLNSIKFALKDVTFEYELLPENFKNDTVNPTYLKKIIKEIGCTFAVKVRNNVWEPTFIKSSTPTLRMDLEFYNKNEEIKRQAEQKINELVSKKSLKMDTASFVQNINNRILYALADKESIKSSEFTLSTQQLFEDEEKLQIIANWMKQHFIMDLDREDIGADAIQLMNILRTSYKKPFIINALKYIECNIDGPCSIETGRGIVQNIWTYSKWLDEIFNDNFKSLVSYSAIELNDRLSGHDKYKIKKATNILRLNELLSNSELIARKEYALIASEEIASELAVKDKWFIHFVQLLENQNHERKTIIKCVNILNNKSLFFLYNVLCEPPESYMHYLKVDFDTETANGMNSSVINLLRSSDFKMALHQLQDSIKVYDVSKKTDAQLTDNERKNKDYLVQEFNEIYKKNQLLITRLAACSTKIHGDIIYILQELSTRSNENVQDKHDLDNIIPKKDAQGQYYVSQSQILKNINNGYVANSVIIQFSIAPGRKIIIVDDTKDKIIDDEKLFALLPEYKPKPAPQKETQRAIAKPSKISALNPIPNKPVQRISMAEMLAQGSKLKPPPSSNPELESTSSIKSPPQTDFLSELKNKTLKSTSGVESSPRTDFLSELKNKTLKSTSGVESSQSDLMAQPSEPTQAKPLTFLSQLSAFKFKNAPSVGGKKRLTKRRKYTRRGRRNKTFTYYAQ